MNKQKEQLLSKTPENDNSTTATITTVKQKATAAIANEIRARAGAWPDEKLKQYDLRLADRIEEAAEQDCEDAERRGNHAATKAICETIEKIGPLYDAESVGNAVKLREALTAILKEANTQYQNDNGIDLTWLMEKAKTALAAPQRNCDRFGGDIDKLREACARERGLNPEEDFPDVFPDWLLAPSTEKKGDAK